jgi:predicted nucleic acid-binding Zn finger protein
MATAARSTARYTVRYIGRTARVEKWDVSGERTCYLIDDDGCSCPQWTYRQKTCRHMRLINLLCSGRLQSGRVYRFERDMWQEAGRTVHHHRATPSETAR